MLFTDGTPADSEALRRYESTVLDVAASQCIDLDAKLEIAAEQVGDELEAWLAQRGHRSTLIGGSVLERVVLSRAIERWHVMQTLEMVFRDAYFQDLNDRYKGKWQMYRQLKAESREDCLALGVGMVSEPMPSGAQPALGFANGRFGASQVFARTTWVSAQGNEGAPGEVRDLSLPDSSCLTAATTSAAPTGARWNLYAGTSPDQLHLQNDSPLDLNDVWIQRVAFRTDTRAAGNGQKPDYVVEHVHQIRRG